MKLNTWAETCIPFATGNIDISLFLNKTKEFFKLDDIKHLSIDKSNYSIPCVIKDCLEKEISYCETNTFSEKHKRIIGDFSGILFFYNKRKLSDLILFKGEHSAEFLYAHIFPYFSLIKETNTYAEKIKESFLCHVNHELKTPLNSIIGQLELFTESNKKITYIKNAHKSAIELYTKIDNILLYSKNDNDFIINNSKFSLQELFSDIRIEYQNKFIQKNIDFILPDILDLSIYSDKTHIRRVFQIIIDNSLKFTNEGYLKVYTEKNNGKVKIFFEDSGCGFSEEILSTIKTNNTISAFSLKLCFELSKILGFELEIQNNSNKGSTVMFTVPYSSEVVCSINNKFYGNVLVAEDDLNNQIVMKHFLENLGFSVVIANNGKEALGLYNKNKYSFILMDCQMPIMDGFEASIEIKKINPIQIIIPCTAHSLVDIRNRSISCGMTGFLTKPINKNSIKETVLMFIPECVDSFDYSIPIELINSHDSTKEGIEFIREVLLKTFESRVKIDFDTLDTLDLVEQKKVFHRLKSTFAQLGFNKTKDFLASLQKQENKTENISSILREKSRLDLININQWLESLELESESKKGVS